MKKADKKRIEDSSDEEVLLFFLFLLLLFFLLLLENMSFILKFFPGVFFGQSAVLPLQGWANFQFVFFF